MKDSSHQIIFVKRNSYVFFTKLVFAPVSTKAKTIALKTFQASKDMYCKVSSASETLRWFGYSLGSLEL